MPQLFSRRALPAFVGWLRGGALIKGTAVVGACVVGSVLLLVASTLHRQTVSAQTAALGRVAYVHAGDLWLKDLPSGTPKQLTTTGGVLRPKWSADGEWLLFLRVHVPQGLSLQATGRDGGAWVIRRDGSDERQLDSDGLVDWSPQGATLAFASPDSSIVTEDADGSNRRSVVAGLSDVSAFNRRQNPRWSADGTWLAFEEERRHPQAL